MTLSFGLFGFEYAHPFEKFFALRPQHVPERLGSRSQIEKSTLFGFDAPFFGVIISFETDRFRFDVSFPDHFHRRLLNIHSGLDPSADRLRHFLQALSDCGV